ncbi:uncharacterized protein LOC134284218 [Aedes albopictus]|uniref:PHD-type domain-containing protein n=1 Tax=Aedes albopictus TaxID=7160 RepID=A0ABM1XNX4_AEDAL
MPETERNDCRVCRRSNNLDNMVFCPRCEEWYHYQCAGVNESVADRSWVCGNCSILPPIDPPGQTSTPVSMVSSVPYVTTTSSAGLQSIAASAPPGLPPAGMSTAAQGLENPRQSILTDQARASLQWIQEQRENLEKEMEENHRQEMERKRQELRKLASKAMLGIVESTNEGIVNSWNGQSAAAGVNKVQNWMQQMVGEMRNLSIAQPSGRAEEIISGAPTFDISSFLTTSGTPVHGLDPTPSSTIHGSQGRSVVIPTTIPSVHSMPVGPSQLSSGSWLGANMQTEINRYQHLGTMPRGLVSRVPPGLGINTQTNVVTACSTVPTVGPTSNHSGLSVVTGPSVAGNPLINTLSQPQFYARIATNTSAPFVQSATSFPNFVPGQAFNTAMNGSSQAIQQFPDTGYANVVGANGGVPLSQSNFQSLPRMPNPLAQLQIVPSQHQLLARQVMPKDLPPFRGDPEDWPLFYSAYVNSTTACGYSDVENLARLQKALQGRAFDAVKSRLLLPACVPQVLNTLYMLFGRPELKIQTLLNKIREVPAPRSDRLDTLISFGMAVQNLCDHLEAAGQIAHLCNPTLLQELVEKFPAQQRLDWALYKRQFMAVDLRTFSTYMSILVAAASDVTVIADIRQSQAGRSDRGKEKNFLNAHSAAEPFKKENLEENISGVVCLACNGPNHKVRDCVIFKKWGPENRWEIVKHYHLCKLCLGKHGQRPCKQQENCGVDGCQLRHHPLLHAEMQKQQVSPDLESNAAFQNVSSGEGVNAHHSTGNATMFRIIPVKLFWNGKSVETFAFLDDGSSMTLIEQSIADRLGIDDGEFLPLGLTWTGNINRQIKNSKRGSVDVSGLGASKSFALNHTRTVPNLELPRQTLKYEELARQYAHLKGLPISSYEAVSPGILIGSNNASLIATLKLREGELGDPLAAKTRLGWSIYGHVANMREAQNFSFHIRENEFENNEDEGKLESCRPKSGGDGTSASKGSTKQKSRKINLDKLKCDKDYASSGIETGKDGDKAVRSRTWLTKRNKGWDHMPRHTDIFGKDNLLLPIASRSQRSLDLPSSTLAVLKRHSVSNAFNNGYGNALRVGECCRYWQHCTSQPSGVPDRGIPFVRE